MVNLLVGPKRKEFTIHKKLLMERSDYFAKAFGSGFKEAKDNSMHLPEDDSDAVDMLVNYVYRNQLPPFSPGESDTDLEESEGYVDKLYQLVFLAEKLCMNELANMAMDQIQDIQYKTEKTTHNTKFEDIYSRTCTSSKLRLYVTAMVVYNTRTASATLSEKEKEEMEAYAEVVKQIPDFASDLVKFEWRYNYRFEDGVVADAQVRDSETGFGRCFLHTHAEGETCHLDKA